MKTDLKEKILKFKEKRKEKTKRNKIIKNNSGVISVYLCLIFAVMISVILVMIEGARVHAIKAELECVTDMGMDSVLSEYHKELFDRYGVLLVDSSYGEKYGSLDNVTDRFKEYASYNLNPQKNLLSEIGSRDLLGLKLDSVSVLSEARATDNNGEVFKYLADSYMLERFGIGYIDYAKSLIEVSDSNKLTEGDIIAENETMNEEINSIELPKWQDEAGEWKEADRCNPIGPVNEMRREGILSLVCKEDVSTKATDLSSLVSHRSLVAGKGINPDWKKRNSLETELLFNEYILLKCANYRKPINNAVLDYQVEYVIAGKNNDNENLKDVVTKILLMRGASNSIYFANHEKLKEQAKLIAEGLSIITLMPDFKDLYEAAVVVAWIFSESVYDVKTLMEGGRIPFIKGEFDWNLSVDKALLMTAQYAAGMEVDANNNNNGQSYEDYLRVLLYMTGKDDRTMRCMDIVEMDIRNITGVSSFSLDDCIAAFQFQIIGVSSYGYEFIANRKCSYW